MATKNLWLADFDPAANYVARKVLKVGADGAGKHRLIHPGQKVPKDQFTERRLRQLYDARWIVKDETAEPAGISTPAPPELIVPLKRDETGSLGGGATYTIEKKGPGWANILKGGEYFEGPFRPKAAEERLAELNAGL